MYLATPAAADPKPTNAHVAQLLELRTTCPAQQDHAQGKKRACSSNSYMSGFLNKYSDRLEELTPPTWSQTSCQPGEVACVVKGKSWQSYEGNGGLLPYSGGQKGGRSNDFTRSHAELLFCQVGNLTRNHTCLITMLRQLEGLITSVSYLGGHICC